MVEARNANYATISRHLCFGKRGAVNVETELGSAGSSRTEKGRHAADTLDDGSDSDTEAPPEPKLLRVSGLSCSHALRSSALTWVGSAWNHAGLTLLLWPTQPSQNSSYLIMSLMGSHVSILLCSECH